MRRALISALIPLAALSASVPAAADVLHMRTGGSVTGHTITFDRNTVAFSKGCDSEVSHVSWQEIARLEFGIDCSSEADPLLGALDDRCAADKFRVFVIELKNGSPPIIAENAVVTKDRLVHFDMFDPWYQAHGSVDSVKQIAKVSICRGDIRREGGLPPSFCTEPRQLAVAFDYEAPLSNRILTNGFSFYVRVSGNKPDDFNLDAFRAEVRSAFQYGISLWTSSLQDKKHLLTEPILEFLDSRTSKSASGFTLLTPPQVIELSCPQAATFVVDLSFGNRSLFPRPPFVLAKAQTEGRTIALNVLDIKCYRTEFHFDEMKRLSFELAGNCLNLVPIMTHELGHAFGIRHINDPNAHALMDSRFSRDALVPTDRDVVEFVKALSRPIAGSAPGEITMISSDGVQPPVDYAECRGGATEAGAARCAE